MTATEPPPRRRRWLAALITAATMISAGVVAVVTAPSASAATVDTNAWYVLVNRNSGKALDVYNLATTDGARITQWTRNDGNQQQWQFVDSGGGYYRLQVPALRQGPRRLQLVHRRRRRRSCSGPTTTAPTSSSAWPTRAGGYVRLINRHSGKAVEVQGASTADGANIVQYADWGGTNQQWQLVRVGGDHAHDRRRRRRRPARALFRRRTAGHRRARWRTRGRGGSRSRTSPPRPTTAGTWSTRRRTTPERPGAR